jgi:hypothetical protein
MRRECLHTYVVVNVTAMNDSNQTDGRLCLDRHYDIPLLAGTVAVPRASRFDLSPTTLA